MCANGRCTFEGTGAHLASSYSVDNHKLTIDGEALAWLLAEGGPRVESVGADDWMHILWVPILVESPMIPEVTEAPGVALHDNGGWLPTGTTLVENTTGKPEPILTAEEWDRVNGA